MKSKALIALALTLFAILVINILAIGLLTPDKTPTINQSTIIDKANKLSLNQTSITNKNSNKTNLTTTDNSNSVSDSTQQSVQTSNSIVSNPSSARVTRAS